MIRTHFELITEQYETKKYYYYVVIIYITIFKQRIFLFAAKNTETDSCAVSARKVEALASQQTTKEKMAENTDKERIVENEENTSVKQVTQIIFLRSNRNNR